MAHDNKHHMFYALIAKTLSELGIAHEVSGAWGNDIIRVSRSAMRDPMQVVAKFQEVCGNTVVVYWNPIDELVCIDGYHFVEFV